MARTLEIEIESLKKKILSFCAVVEENVRDAIKALVLRDTALAAKVIDTDEEIDAMEVTLEEECLKTLALYQPVAKDLRFIIAVFNINNDLERIGDLAVNIAERALSLAACSEIDIPFDYTKMAEKVLAMVKNSLDSLVQMDPELARQVCEEDNEVDVINRQAYTQGPGTHSPISGAGGLPHSISGDFQRTGAHRRPRHQHCRRSHLPGQRRNRPP